MTKKNSPKSFYDDSFYHSQLEESLLSAQKYADIFCQHFKCSTLVDVGCGRGAWLKAFKERAGSSHAVGIDGGWNAEKLIDPTIHFVNLDLNSFSFTEFNLDIQRYDLAISVEVAEHLHPSKSEEFINELTKLSDVILFSAGFLGQEGVGHINLRKHSDWARIFARNGFVPLDIFRPCVYGDPNVKWWYQSNVFLYVLDSSDYKPSLITNLDWMDCVHPALYECARRSYFSQSLKHTLSLLVPAIARKFRLEN